MSRTCTNVAPALIPTFKQMFFIVLTFLGIVALFGPISFLQYFVELMLMVDLISVDEPFM